MQLSEALSLLNNPKDYVTGIDISHWNTDYEIQQTISNIKPSFCYIKLTEGDSDIDVRSIHRYALLKEKFPIGFYHILTQDAIDMQRRLMTQKLAGLEYQLTPMIDLETAQSISLPGLIEARKAFPDGKPPITYCNLSTDNELELNAQWLADYSQAPNMLAMESGIIWQFNGSGVDLNICCLTQEQFMGRYGVK